MTTPSSSILFLLVEDNAAHAELVIRSMRDFGLLNKVFHVSDGEQALDYLFQRNQFSDPRESPRPDVILLDLNVPKIDGLDVLSELKASSDLCTIPVVILTTSTSEDDVAKAYGNHANSYLVKPVDFEQFRQLMKDLGYYWVLVNHRPSEQE